MIQFSCPQCGKVFNVPDEAGGKRSKCPVCGESLRVPRSVEASTHAQESKSLGSQVPESPMREAMTILMSDPKSADDPSKPSDTLYVSLQDLPPTGARQQTPKSEPWYYRFLDFCAGLVLVFGLLAAIFSMIAPLATGQPLLFAFSVVLLIYVPASAGFIHLAVNIARNLRRMRQNTDELCQRLSK